MSRLAATAVVLTKNEERALPACLESLKDFAQVLVIDSGSTDGTVDIADRHGAEVVQFAWDGRYPKKKQWALQHPRVEHDWVLFVDADERPDEQLVDWLSRFLVTPTAAAVDVQLRYVFLGRELKHGHRVVKRALVDRRRADFPVVDDLWVTNMWEVEGHYQPTIRGSVAFADGGLIHNDVDPLYDWIGRHNRYSDWEAALRLHPEVRHQIAAARSQQGQLFDRVPFKPVAFFAYSYLIKSGWRDGRQGFDYACGLAFYYWQIACKVRSNGIPQRNG